MVYIARASKNAAREVPWRRLVMTGLEWNTTESKEQEATEYYARERLRQIRMKYSR